MTIPEMQNPPGQAGVASAKTGRTGLTDDDTAAWLPSNLRGRLPAPALYRGLVVLKLGAINALGVARGHCPLRPDEANSLTLHLGDSLGAWRCDAGCGGGDLIGFHQRLTRLSFKAALRNLLGHTP